MIDRVLRPRNVVLLFCVVFAVSIPQITKLTTDHDYMDLLPYGDQGARDYEEYLERFPSDAGALVVASGHSLCSPPAWGHHRRLTDNLEDLDGVDRVIALTTSKHVRGLGDAVEVTDFLPQPPDADADLCVAALRYKPYQGLLVNHDASAMAFYVVAQDGADPMLLSDSIQGVIEKLRPLYQEDGGDLFQSGELYASTGLSRATDKAALLLPIVVLLMLLVARYQTRSWRVAILVAATGMFGTLFTFSLMGFLDLAQNPINVLVINLFIPLGAAFAIHAHGYMRRAHSLLFGWLPEQALRPFAFAGLTTMIGFGSTALSSVPAVQQLGLLGIFGISMSLFTTFMLTFPVLSSLQGEPRSDNLSGREVDGESYVLSRRGLLGTLSVLTLASIIGCTMLRVNYCPIDYLKESNPVHISFERTRKLFGTYSIPFTVFGDEGNAAIDPELQQAVHAFVENQKKLFPGMQASEFFNQLSEVSLAFSAEVEPPILFPKSKEGIAQFLLFFDERDTEPYLDHDRRSLTVLLQTPFRSSAEFRALDQNVRRFAETHELHASLVGRVAQFFRAGDIIALNNIRSLAVGIGLVGICFVVLFRSSRLAMFALLANILPVVGSLALLGLFRIDLDIGSSIVSAAALGLVVDDTGHLVANYSAYVNAGNSAKASAKLAVDELRGPIIMTTVTIVSGFLVMNLAGLIPFHTFSRLLSVTMIYALFGDLVILPSLLANFDKSRS